MADEIMRQGVIGLADIVIKPGLINVDFADVRAVMDNLDPRRLSPTLSPTLTPTTGPEQVRAVMTGAGKALMGIGRGFGPTRAVDAALAAISSPLLDFPISEVRRVPPIPPTPRPSPPLCPPRQAKGVVFTITGNENMALSEVNEVATLISEMVSDEANIIFGTSVDESFGDEISVTLVATSLPGGGHEAAAISQPAVIDARPRPAAASSPLYKAR